MYWKNCVLFQKGIKLETFKFVHYLEFKLPSSIYYNNFVVFKCMGFENKDKVYFGFVGIE